MHRPDVKTWHTCPSCGKRAWPTRKAAKQAARGRFAMLTAYRCEERPAWWHLGNRPPEVARGTIPRANVRHIPDEQERSTAARFAIRGQR